MLVLTINVWGVIIDLIIQKLKKRRKKKIYIKRAPLSKVIISET